MISLKSSHNRLLLSTLSVIAMVAVACSSSSASPTQSPSSPNDSAPTATAQGSGSQAETESATSTPSSSNDTESPATPQAPAASNRIAITASDGSIYTINPDGSDRQQITATNAGDLSNRFAAFYGWPIWSPDGRHLLISAFTPDVSGGLETSLLRTSATRPEAFPELLYRDVPGTNGIGGVPHFPVWHPDGGSLALIANVGDGLSTFLVDVEDGLGSAVSNGAPVYLDWSTDGSRMLVHTADRLVLHEFGPDGGRTNSEQIGVGAVSYRVPKFAPESNDYAYIDIADGLRNLLVRSPSESSPTQVRLARANNSFAWSPEGDRIAFADGNRAGFYETLRIVNPDGEATDDVIVNTPVLAFWWSPDGKSILIAMPGGEVENVALAVADSATGDINLLGLFQPSAEMGFVISFFDQYAADLRLWSPDSSRFIFSGVLKDGLKDEAAGTQVQLGDPDSKVWVIDPSGVDQPLSLGLGGFGTWSPE